MGMIESTVPAMSWFQAVLYWPCSVERPSGSVIICGSFVTSRGQRKLFQFAREGQEELAQEEHPKDTGNAREDQTGVGIGQAQYTHEYKEGSIGDLRWHHQGCQVDQEQGTATAET